MIELQAAGANVNAAEAGSGVTALHLACFFGAVDAARCVSCVSGCVCVCVHVGVGV